MPDIPRIWWSPTMGLITKNKYGGCYDVYDEYDEELSNLPDDAVELGPIHHKTVALHQQLVEDEITTREEDNIQDLLSAIWLSVNWRSVTKNLTLSQKTLWADYLDSNTFKVEEKVDRWWI